MVRKISVKGPTREQLWQSLVDRALSYPGAFEDHPWGETVAKVGKKIFVFFGTPDQDGRLVMSVKLPESGAGVLEEDYAEPTGYGLGRAGWVTVRFPADLAVPVDQAEEWIDESYRAVAPKTLVKQLDAHGLAQPAQTRTSESQRKGGRQ